MKKSNWITIPIILISCIGGVYYAIDNVMANNIYGALIRISIIPVMFAPQLLKRLFKIELAEHLKVIYVIFVFFSHFLGSIVDFYHVYVGYDKWMHFISGILTGILALNLIEHYTKGKKQNTMFVILFILSFSMLVASCWEFFEFICDHQFNRDAQNVLTTGVDDTMLDMLVAFIGTIFVSIWYAFQKRIK